MMNNITAGPSSEGGPPEVTLTYVLWCISAIHLNYFHEYFFSDGLKKAGLHSEL